MQSKYTNVKNHGRNIHTTMPKGIVIIAFDWYKYISNAPFPRSNKENMKNKIR